MKVKEIATYAIDHINDLFGEEKISNLGLEEVEFNSDTGEWEVTVGFSRPWDYPHGALATIAGEASAKRTYKVVTVNDTSGNVLSVKNRPAND